MVETSPGSWFVEEGIGEQRAIRLENGQVTAAKLHWPDRLGAGQVEDAILIARTSGSKRGTARFASGEEALVDELPRDASEGATLRLKVFRAAIGEARRFKLAQAKPTDAPPRDAPGLAERLRQSGETVQVVRRFPVADWPELIAEAWDGHIAFAGGSLTITPTPAMTLIDIDGSLPPRQLALAAIEPLALSIRRFDLGGSIGIDFPTLTERSDRRTVDEGLHASLANWPHQRTAMNGFGFVQLVARLEGPSLVQRIQCDRASAAARLLLRRAEMIEEPGALLLVANPVIHHAIGPRWNADLARRAGRELIWREDAALALHAGFAQAVAP